MTPLVLVLGGLGLALVLKLRRKAASPAPSTGTKKPSASPPPKSMGDVATALPADPSSAASSAKLLGNTEGSGDGLEWAKTLPAKPGKAREQQIFDAVKAGMARTEWVEMPVQVGDLKVTIPVMARTLRIGKTNPVRVSVNYETAQQIADFLGAAMMTPHVADLTRVFSTNALEPVLKSNWVNDGTMANTNRMVEYSQALDKLVSPDDKRLTSNEGKHWVVSARFWNDKDASKRWPPNKRSANYGWWSKSAPNKRPVGPVWQTTGLAHNWEHVDYSQQVQLMSQFVTVEGQGKVHVGQILADPKLNVLLSDEGPLGSWAHPAFEKKTPVPGVA